MRRLIGWFGAIAWACTALAAGCIDDARTVGSNAQPIMGGDPDFADTSIVSIVISGGGSGPGGGVCSGSLIAPNVVITARHCVSYVPDEPVWCADYTESDGAVHSATLTNEPHPAGNFIVTTNQSLRRQRDGGVPTVHFVSRVVIPPDSTGVPLCGHDIGLLVLADNVPPTEATPLVPRLDLPPEVGELYTAIGYGGTDDNGTGLGQRRILGDLAVMLVGERMLGSPLVVVQTDAEWSGDHGVCGGDSGGPALSDHREVIGAVSRGAMNCDTPTYTRIDSFAALIRQTAAEASAEGHYPPPFWLTPNNRGSVPTGRPCLAHTDCMDPAASCLYPASDSQRRLCLGTDCANCAAGYACPSDGTQICVPLLPPDAGYMDAGAVDAMDAAQFTAPAVHVVGGCSVGHGAQGGRAIACFAVAAIIGASMRRRRFR